MQTGALEITARTPEGRVAWVVRAKAAATSVAVGGGIGPAVLTGVEGEVHDEAGVASTFSAERASADKSTRQLELEGGVRLLAKRGAPPADAPVTLTADRLRWMDGRGLVEATGNVGFSSDVWSLGPFRVQWATPDLATIGSPDQFP